MTMSWLLMQASGYLSLTIHDGEAIVMARMVTSECRSRKRTGEERSHEGTASGFRQPITTPIGTSISTFTVPPYPSLTVTVKLSLWSADVAPGAAAACRAAAVGV
jgi:hypothetical protein